MRRFFVSLVPLILLLGGVASPAQAEGEQAEILEMFHQPMPQGWVDLPRPAPPEFERSGWSRPDFLLPLYAGDMENVPARGGENIGYFSTLLAHVAEECERLDPHALALEMTPYIAASGIDLFQRMFEGDLSGPETVMLLAAGITTFTERHECRVPLRLGQSQRDLAQRRCDGARAGLNALGVMMNAGATADAHRLAKTYPCDSPQMLWMEDRIREFARTAHRLVRRPATLPAPETAEGRVYHEILGNCLRRSWGEAEINYCSCYVGELYRANPPREILNRLARDPFVSARTWRSPVLEAVSDRRGIQSCLDPAGDRPRTYRAPRPTACLIDEAQEGGLSACTYRAAWGVFKHVSEKACVPELSSRQWGSDLGEVSCVEEVALVPAEPAGPVPRVWMQHKSQRVDFEMAVPDDFAPLLRDLVPELVRPTYVSFLERDAPGALRRMSYERFNLAFVAGFDTMRARDHQQTDMLLWKSGDVLHCDYRAASGGLIRHTFWYEDVPQEALSDQIPAEIRPEIDAMRPARLTCPAQRP